MFSVSFFHHFFFIRSFYFEVNLLHQSDLICLLCSTRRRILNESEKMRKEDKMIKDQHFVVFIYLLKSFFITAPDFWRSKIVLAHENGQYIKSHCRIDCVYQNQIYRINNANHKKKSQCLWTHQEDAEKSQNQNQTLNPADDEWRVFNGPFQFDFNRTAYRCSLLNNIFISVLFASR